MTCSMIRSLFSRIKIEMISKCPFRYKLVSFSNLGPYMESIGVPSFVIPLIKGMSQVVTFETPDEPGGEWVMATETGKFIKIHT